QATETVKAGDFLRVYVVPEDDAYVYVVYNDGKAPVLLNTQNAHTKVPKGSLVTWPAPEEFYPIAGTSDTESITVICSPTEIRAVAALFRTTNVPQQSWTSLEKELMEQSKTDVTHTADTPFPRVGNVRWIYDKQFVDSLQTLSGATYVVKR